MRHGTPKNSTPREAPPIVGAVWRRIFLMSLGLMVAAIASASAAFAPIHPRLFHSPTAIYSQKKLQAYLKKSTKLSYGAHPLSRVERTLSRYKALPAGLTGETTVLGTGSPSLAGPPPPGVPVGPPIEELTLVFFSTPALARAGIQKIAYFFVYGQGRPALLYKPPPLPRASSVVWLAGNVVAVWRNPIRHATLDARVLWNCLAVSGG